MRPQGWQIPSKSQAWLLFLRRILFSFASHAAKQGRGGETGLQKGVQFAEP